MENKKETKTETILLRLTKEQKKKIFNIVEKSSYSSASDLIRAGIEKEINLQIYKDNMNEITMRIELLRGEMMKNDIDYYIILSSDYHDSEYVDGYFKEREYMSGFNGSQEAW